MATMSTTFTASGSFTLTDSDGVVVFSYSPSFTSSSNIASTVLYAGEHLAGTGADPSTDSEVLSDYEHGTWTPRIRAYDHTGGAGWGFVVDSSGNVPTGTARYVRVGRLVFASGYNGDTITNRMYVDSYGNVVIGAAYFGPRLY